MTHWNLVVDDQKDQSLRDQRSGDKSIENNILANHPFTSKEKSPVGKEKNTYYK